VHAPPEYAREPPQALLKRWKLDGWQTPATRPVAQPIDLAACDDTLMASETVPPISSHLRGGTGPASQKV